MGLEEFGDLPPRLEDWTFDTVVNLVKKYEFEPTFRSFIWRLYRFFRKVVRAKPGRGDAWAASVR